MLNKIWKFIITCISTLLIVIILLLTIPFMPIALISVNFSRGLMYKVWGKLTIWATFSRVDISFQEAIPYDSSPLIYISNHQSYFDIPLLLGWIDPLSAFVARRTLLKMPILGLWMKILGCEFLDRKVSRKELESMNMIAEKISNGKKFFIFPEGTRTPDGKIHTFKKSSERMVISNNSIIVPIYVKGTYNILSKNKFEINPSKVYIRVGKPQHSSEFEKGQLFKYLQNWMYSMEHDYLKGDSVEEDNLETYSHAEA